MKQANLTLPEIALIAGTRGMLGAGVAFLLADRISTPSRRAIGWTLFAVGALTTIPLAANVFGKSRASLRAVKAASAER